MPVGGNQPGATAGKSHINAPKPKNPSALAVFIVAAV
jgi:hypothetical protein